MSLPCSAADRADRPFRWPIAGMRGEHLHLLLDRKLVNEGDRAGQRVGHLGEPADERRASFEQCRELVLAQLPR